MTLLAKQERDLLQQVRCMVRDIAHNWQPDEVELQAEDVCLKLSKMLGEEYDFATGDITKEAAAPTGPRAYRVATCVATADLENTLNAFAEAGYQIQKQTRMQDGSWVVSAFDPVLVSQKAGQLMANQVADMMNRAGLGPMKTP
jgi:hypothetical protein